MIRIQGDIKSMNRSNKHEQKSHAFVRSSFFVPSFTLLRNDTGIRLQQLVNGGDALSRHVALRAGV
jgi:hypothetical protein